MAGTFIRRLVVAGLTLLAEAISSSALVSGSFRSDIPPPSELRIVRTLPSLPKLPSVAGIPPEKPASGIAYWLTRDPLGEPGGPNLTLAMNGDFVNNIDPLGLDWKYYEGGDPRLLGLFPLPSSSVEFGRKYMYGTTWWEDGFANVANIGYFVNNGVYRSLTFLCKDIRLNPDDPMTPVIAATGPVSVPLSTLSVAEASASTFLSRMWVGIRGSSTAVKFAEVTDEILTKLRFKNPQTKTVPCQSGPCVPNACEQYGNACGVPAQVSPQTVAAKSEVGKPFAMGLTDEGLEAFANARGATTWKQLPNPEQWKAGVLEKLADPKTPVHFNLDGVDVWQGVQRAASGRGGPTDWELLQIRQNPQFWDTIQFWKGGKPVGNPFK